VVPKTAGDLGAVPRLEAAPVLDRSSYQGRIIEFWKIYYLVTGIDYTLGQKEGRHQGFVLVNRPQILLDPLE
jgi:hypothetical protein